MNDTNPKLDSRQPGSEPSLPNDEETLVVDSRADLTPSQIVEQKLIRRMKESPLLVSQIQRRLKPGPR